MERTIIYDLHSRTFSKPYSLDNVSSIVELNLDYSDTITLDIECHHFSTTEKENLDYIMDFSHEYNFKINRLVYVDYNLKDCPYTTIEKDILSMQEYGILVLVKIDGFYYVEPRSYLSSIRSIKDVASSINTYLYKGKPLTTFEKYILAFYYTANRVYNMSPDFGNNAMRHYVGVETSDYVICSGFSSLLAKVCDETFDHNDLICFRQGSDVLNKSGTLLGGHANNLVLIRDDKYKLHGVYHTDSCWCSPKTIESNPKDSKVHLNYCLMPLGTLITNNRYSFLFQDSLFLYEYIGAKCSPFASPTSLINKDTIENFVLEYFGYKSTKTIGTMHPRDTFYTHQRECIESVYNIAISRLKDALGDVDLVEALSTTTPAMLSMGIFAENNKTIDKFLNQIVKLINNKKFDAKYIIDTLHSSLIPKILDMVQSIDSSISQVTSFSDLIKDIIALSYHAPKDSPIGKTYDQYIMSLRDTEIHSFLKKNKSIIAPKTLPTKIFASPLEILASFIGIDDRDIPTFVAKKLQELETLQLQEFTGIFDKLPSK